eukprot:1477982-Pyramimonas_sp.AAC.1
MPRNLALPGIISASLQPWSIGFEDVKSEWQRLSRISLCIWGSNTARMSSGHASLLHLDLSRRCRRWVVPGSHLYGNGHA